MTWEQFWTLNPYILKRMKEAYEERLKEQDLIAWMYGNYNYIALSIALHNSFSKGKRGEYPKEPVLFKKTDEVTNEDELDKQRKLFLAKLTVMQSNFEATHPKTSKTEA